MNNRPNTLRDYQKEIVARVQEAWKHHRSVMVQMPTGTGKTHVLAGVVNGFSGKVLIVAHRIELVEQISETVNVFSSFANAPLEKTIRVASIQRMARRMDSPDFTPDLVVIDEAHHTKARTYRILWEKWPEAKFLGLTATPCRMNRSGFTDLFECLITSWSIAEFIRKGILSPFDYLSIRPDSAEQQIIDSLEKRGADGDYQIKEMEAVLNRRPGIERLYRSVVQFAGRKKGMVYAVSIAHARNIAEYYNRRGVPSVAIDSRTPREERRRLVEEFKAGKIQVLVNVDVFSEGFDCPDVEFIQMARPTLSLAKYLQQAGRGLRKTHGKDSCILMDNVGLYRTFGLPVRAWDWESMFRGGTAGKGSREIRTAGETAGFTTIKAEAPEEESGIGMVISHETLLAKLEELEKVPVEEQKAPELKAWQDERTGLWGLRSGRQKVTEAGYRKVFAIRGKLAAVHFACQVCGLVDETGQTVWKRNNCISLKFSRNDFLTVRVEGNQDHYVDLRNLKTYTSRPEIRRYGNFELLKVKYTCYSRTKRLYSSTVDYEGIIITDRGFLLSLFESPGKMFCLLEGDNEDFYRIHRWLTDGSAVISDKAGHLYHAKKGSGKVCIGNTSDPEGVRERMERLDHDIRQRLKENREEEKQRIREEYRKAVPYRAGMKWGLKVGNRITIPPIYRNIKPPVGKYCAVEKNYSQWGIITIDGVLLVEPKYSDVAIRRDGTAWLTQATGRKVAVKLQ